MGCAGATVACFALGFDAAVEGMSVVAVEGTWGFPLTPVEGIMVDTMMKGDLA